MFETIVRAPADRELQIYLYRARQARAQVLQEMILGLWSMITGRRRHKEVEARLPEGLGTAH